MSFFITKWIISKNLDEIWLVFCWPYSLLDVNLHVEYFKIPFSIEFFHLYGLNSYIDFVRSCIGFKTLHSVLRILDVQYIIHQIFLRFLDVTCLATSYHLVKEKPTYFYYFKIWLFCYISIQNSSSL